METKYNTPYAELIPKILANIKDNPLLLNFDKDYNSELYHAAVDIIRRSSYKSKPFTVEALCNRAYISRSLFYTKYKNVKDFTEKMANDAVHAISIAILFHALGARKTACERPFCRKETSDRIKSLAGSYSFSESLSFTQRIYQCVNDIFFTVLKEAKGLGFIKTNYEILDRYIFTTIYILLHTIVYNDKELFTAFINDLLTVKNKLGF